MRRFNGLFAHVALGALCLVFAINVAVRSLGGEVGLFSIERLVDRTFALAFLCAHQLRGPFSTDLAPENAVRAAALRHGVSTRLALAVARAESDFVPTRISGAGAMGVMQLMPQTALALGVSDPFDPAQNADGGVRLLAELLTTYRGDVRRALAAYNAGPTRVTHKPASAWPAETRHYVARIVASL